MQRITVLLQGSQDDCTEKEFKHAVATLVSTFRFWGPEEQCQRLNPSMPSFQPAVASIKKRLELVGGQDNVEHDEEEAAFAELYLKQRALEKKDSQESEPAEQEDEVKMLSAHDDLQDR